MEPGNAAGGSRSRGVAGAAAAGPRRELSALNRSNAPPSWTRYGGRRRSNNAWVARLRGEQFGTDAERDDGSDTDTEDMELQVGWMAWCLRACPAVPGELASCRVRRV